MIREIVCGVRLKALDVVVFVLSAAATVVLAISVYGRSSKSPVAVMSSPEGQWILPLSTEQVVAPTSLEDGCVVSIQDRSVRVLRSGCPEQICVRTGSIYRQGQWIACLPHRVFIRIEGGEQAPVDAVTF